MSLRVDADKPTPVQDLGIIIGPGPVWIEQEDFQRSTCLQALIRLGKVRVSSSQRCRVSQDPPKKPRIHSVGLSRPSKTPRGTHTRHTETIKEVVKEGIDAAQAQEMVSKAATEAAQAAVAAVLGQLPQGGGGDLGNLDNRIEQAITRALGSVHLTSSHAGGDLVVNGPEDPLFIPTGIVRDDTEILTIQSDSSVDGGGLDDAASALKALRKKKKS